MLHFCQSFSLSPSRCSSSPSCLPPTSFPHPHPPPPPAHPLPSRLEDSIALRLCAPKELKLSAGEAVKWKNLIALREKPSLFICKFLGHAFFPTLFYTYLSLSLSRVLAPTRLLSLENIRPGLNTHTLKQKSSLQLQI